MPLFLQKLFEWGKCVSYKVKLDNFEGPFDLLVYLIENARMSVYDIQVAEITNQYLVYIEQMKRLDVVMAAEFMTLAATLIEIKSKLLLPRMVVDEEGNLTLEDPRKELVERLMEYKRFRCAAEMLESREEEALKLYEKPKEDFAQSAEAADAFVSLDIKQFAKAFRLFLLKKKRVEEIHKTVEKIELERATGEAKIAFIRAIFALKNKKTVKFQELLQVERDRYEIALTFSSILEMARQKAIKLRQSAPFGSITVTEGRIDGDQ